MAATNIFYRIPSQRGTRVATLAGSECTLDQFCNYIIDSEGLNRNDFIIASGTKIFRPSSCNLQTISLQNNSHVDILIPLLGGKGGFGSLLRAIGAQIEKTTNRDACRDLSGRRLRDVKRTDELKKLIALQKKLQEEKKRKRREKLERLKKKTEASATSASIQQLVSMFDDHEYNERRMELGDIIEAAVEKGIINFEKRQQAEEEDKRKKKLRLEESDTCEKNSGSGTAQSDIGSSELGNLDETLHSGSKHKGQIVREKLPNRTKKNDLWLGLEDGDDSDDEEEDIERVCEGDK